MKYPLCGRVVEIQVICTEDGVFPVTREGMSLRTCIRHSAFHKRICSTLTPKVNPSMFSELRRGTVYDRGVDGTV